MLADRIQEMVQTYSGKIGVYFKNLSTGESFGINADEPFVAASVIKVPIMVEVYRAAAKGTVRLDQVLKVQPEDKVPSCGVLRLMHDYLPVEVQDLVNLMITISDNTATNILINLLGMDSINRSLAETGLTKTRVNRLLFDVEARKRGLQNYFTPAEIGLLLEKMWQGALVSAEASEAMLEVLANQQLNHKIPYYLPKELRIAHKTGEDEGTTHNVGIIFVDRPFILCLTANDTDVPVTEHGFRQIALACYEDVVR